MYERRMDNVEEAPSGEETKTFEKIELMVENARQAIEEETKRANNTWLAAFANKLKWVQGSFNMYAMNHPEAASRVEEYQEKLLAVDARVKELAQEYPGAKAKELPEDVRDELLGSLNIFRGY